MRSLSKRPAVCATLVLAVCAALSLFAFEPWAPSPELSVAAGSPSVVEHAYGVLHVVYAIRPLSLRRVVFYEDFNYANGRGFDRAFAHGFKRHVRYDLKERGVFSTVISVDAHGLRSTLSSPPRGTILLILGGILPSGVRSSGTDLLRQWIARGGEVFWAGAPFDAAWSSRPSTINVDYTKWPQIYGEDTNEPLGQPRHAMPKMLLSNKYAPQMADILSPPIETIHRKGADDGLMGLTFDRTTFAFPAALASRMHGRALAGVDQNGDSAVSAFPFKLGWVVFFADGCLDDVSCSQDIAQITWLAGGGPYRPVLGYATRVAGADTLNEGAENTECFLQLTSGTVVPLLEQHAR